MRRIVIFLQFLKKKIFCFLITTFVFYCDEKHLDILWGPVMFVVTCFQFTQKCKLVFYTMTLKSDTTFPQERFQNLIFPNAFNNCLINCRKIVPCLMQYSKNMENDQKPRCSYSIVTAVPQFENFAILIITHQNLKIILSLLLLSHS